MYENERFETGEQVTESLMQDALLELIAGAEDDPYEIGFADARVQTYELAEVMTYNKGLVITLPDGSEFQLTIVRNR